MKFLMVSPCKNRAKSILIREHIIEIFNFIIYLKISKIYEKKGQRAQTGIQKDKQIQTTTSIQFYLKII